MSALCQRRSSLVGESRAISASRLVASSDRHADHAGILSDVRRGGWIAGGLFPQGTSPRCEVFGRGRRRTNCRLVLTATSDDEFPLWVKTGFSAMSRRCPLYPRKRTLKLGREMSALSHFRTNCIAAKCILFVLRKGLLLSSIFGIGVEPSGPTLVWLVEAQACTRCS